MTRLLLIDCRTLHIARYDGRKQSPEIAKIGVPFDDESSALKELDAFRRHGHAGLEASTQHPGEAR